MTEAIGSYYGDEQPPARLKDPRPLSYMHSPSEAYESKGAKRQGSYFDPRAMTSPPRTSSMGRNGNGSGPVSGSGSGAQRVTSPTSPSETGSLSPKSAKSMKRKGSARMETMNGGHRGDGQPTSPPPPLSRQTSSETATQQFPLNDIDYESSPAAVAQELSNLQAIRRMSMNVDKADPDLPSFGGVVPTIAPKRADGEDDENDPSRLFWVPARLHPELAPKEFKTFLEDRVDQIRRRSGDSDSLTVDGMERSASSSSSLRRKKSMLSHTIDTKGNYEDGAERLERKKSKGVSVERQATVANLSDLETLVNDPAQLMRRMSMDTVRRSEDSGIEVPATQDMPILPPNSQSLKRSTRTTYRRGSLKKGERVPFSKRAQQRHTETSDAEDSPTQSPTVADADHHIRSGSEPILGLTRVQTEPTPPPTQTEQRDDYAATSHAAGGRSRRRPGLGASHSSDNLIQASESRGMQTSSHQHERRRSPPHDERASVEDERPQSSPAPYQYRPQQRQFQSRLASGPGRTTAQLPGYNNQNPLPHIIETLPDGTKVPVGPLAQQASFPDRKSSHELPRPIQRGGAHMRPAPGRQQASPSSTTLDDISGNPSPLPGSGSTRTDALTMVPTFEDKKVEKKDGLRKSSWKWILGNDDDEKKSKEEKGQDGAPKPKSKLSKNPASQEKARLDVLQNSIDGTIPPRGRESLMLNREDIKLEEERKKEAGKKSSESSRKEKDKSDTGLLSAIFGGKKKTSDGDLKDKKSRKPDRGLSPEPPQRILKPDIDYNWTRFSILEERAIYRMAHIKLANPRRALYSQVLLSNFMYSYLAKVQMMHPQQMPGGQQQQQQQAQKKKEEQPAEFAEYQRWQEVSCYDEMSVLNDECDANESSSNKHAKNPVTDLRNNLATASQVARASKSLQVGLGHNNSNSNSSAQVASTATSSPTKDGTPKNRTTSTTPPTHPLTAAEQTAWAHLAAAEAEAARHQGPLDTASRARTTTSVTPRTSSPLAATRGFGTMRRRRRCGERQTAFGLFMG